jgi:hypothetical protein
LKRLGVRTRVRRAGAAVEDMSSAELATIRALSDDDAVNGSDAVVGPAAEAMATVALGAASPLPPSIRFDAGLRLGGFFFARIFISWSRRKARVSIDRLEPWVLL